MAIEAKASTAGRPYEVAALAAVFLVSLQHPFVVARGGNAIGYIMYSDFALLFLFGFAPARLRSRWHRPSTTEWCALALLGAALISAVLHPTIFGFVAIIRLTGATMIGGVVAAMVREGRWKPVAAVAGSWIVLQTAIGVAQLANRGVVGLGAFGESSDSFEIFKGVFAPSGTLTHRNSFAVLAVALGGVVLALRTRFGSRDGGADRVAGLVVLGCVGLSAGMSMSRTSFVTIALIGLAVALKRNIAAARGWAAMVAGFGVAAVYQLDGWSRRGSATVGGSGLDAMGSGRIAIMKQSLAIWRLDPVFGVGPGRYLIPIFTRKDIASMASQKIPVHNVWLFVLASLGVVGALALGSLTLVVGWRAWRSGIGGLIVCAALIPGLMLDVALFIWSGTMVLALGIGVVCGLDASRGHGGKSPKLVGQSQEHEDGLLLEENKVASLA